MAGTAAQAQQSIPYVAPQAEMLPYQNPSLTPQQRAEDLCQRLTLEDMNHYTTVKTHMFNGIHHPSLLMMHSSGKVEILREYTYDDYKNRMD